MTRAHISLPVPVSPISSTITLQAAMRGICRLGASTGPSRSDLVRRAFRLEWLTAAWMLIEAAVAIGSGVVAHSLSLIAFGVRAGLMAPAYTTKVPLASDVELGAFLGGAALGMISVLLMVFLGFAENDLDNPLFLPISVGPILLGGLLLLTGAALAFRTVRRRRSPSAA